MVLILVQFAEISIFLPILLVGISKAIQLSSSYLSQVETIGFEQFLTSVGIAIPFIPISFALPYMDSNGKNRYYKDSFTHQLCWLVMAGPIYLSSSLLSRVTEIPLNLLLNITLQRITLSVIGITLGISFVILGKLDPESLLIGGISILVISGVIGTSFTNFKFRCLH
jgi:quinol-cytochrome oxidoreductase complex cytochrome b subunit